MTKQLNKKGTSLVELIAVIVIMGIIAGIAVPVTIAVINRQKKNAAAKSAEAVVATIKQLTQELVAQATSSITIELDYGTTNGNKPIATTGVKVTVDTTTYTNTQYPETEFLVENLKAQGKIKSVYTVSSATYSFTGSEGFMVNGYDIAVAADGSATASTHTA